MKRWRRHAGERQSGDGRGDVTTVGDAKAEALGRGAAAYRGQRRSIMAITAV